MRLAEPAWLLALVLLPWPWLRERRRPRLPWSTLDGFAEARGFLARWVWVPPVLRTLALACLIVALARPQVEGGRVRIAAQGVAIVVALDHSSSMNAPDFPTPEGGRISRLEAAKRTFSTFARNRTDDLVGLVVFAKAPDLICPPTLDVGFRLDAAASVRPVRPGDDGTNIGDAIAWSLRALRAAPATVRKKVLILLTDGGQAPGVPDAVDPDDAAKLARDLGVTLHTVAIGRAGGIVRGTMPEVDLPVSHEVAGPDLDLLGRLAQEGGGRMFRAADARALDQVFAALDALEKSPVQGTVRVRYEERFAPWALAASLMLALDLALSAGRLRSLP